MTMKVLLLNEGTFDFSLLQNFVEAGACSLVDIDLPVVNQESSPVHARTPLPEEPVFHRMPQSFSISHQLLLGKAKEYIDNHYMDPNCSLSFVARSIHVSHSHLSLIFKEVMGTTFTNYLTMLRIKKAQQLLASTDLMIYEVTARVGYENATYFSTVFKKATGLSPKEYRNERRVVNLRFDAPIAAVCQKS